MHQPYSLKFQKTAQFFDPNKEIKSLKTEQTQKMGCQRIVPQIMLKNNQQSIMIDKESINCGHLQQKTDQKQLRESHSEFKSFSSTKKFLLKRQNSIPINRNKLPDIFLSENPRRTSKFRIQSAQVHTQPKEIQIQPTLTCEKPKEEDKSQKFNFNSIKLPSIQCTLKGKHFLQRTPQVKIINRIFSAKI